MMSARFVVDLTIVAASAAFLACVYWALARTVEVLPLEPSVRARLRRSRPLLGMTLVLLFLLWTARTFFGRYEVAGPLSLLVVLVGFFIAAMRPLRDYLAGVALVAEGSLKVGDQVRIGDLRGRVLELGPRGITLETTDGDRALVPYSSAQETPIVRLSGSEGGTSAHSFVLPRNANVAETRRRIVALVQGHHFSAVGRLPDFQLLPDGLEVTIHALDAAFVLDIEQTVREGLEPAGSSNPPAVPELKGADL